MNTIYYKRVTEEDQPELEVDISLQKLQNLQALSSHTTVVVASSLLQFPYPWYTHESSIAVTWEFPPA